MTGWWTTHFAVRVSIGTVLLLCAAYCLGRLVLARRAPARASAASITGNADASHVVVNVAMAVVFFPLGDKLSGQSWALVFSLMAAGFVVLSVRSVRRPRSLGPSRSDAVTAGYHAVCAAGMVYMYLGGARPMRMSGDSMSTGLRFPAIGWILVVFVALDALALLAVLATGGGLGARSVLHKTSHVTPRTAQGTSWERSVLQSRRVALVPHVAVNASMGAMLLVMLAGR